MSSVPPALAAGSSSLVPLVVLAPNAGAVSTTLVINEVDYDQPSLDTAEFLELKNVSGSAISLNGWTVELFNGATSLVYRTTPLPDVSLPAGDYFLDLLESGDDGELRSGRRPRHGPDPERRSRRDRLRNAGALVDAVSYDDRRSIHRGLWRGSHRRRQLDDRRTLALPGRLRHRPEQHRPRPGRDDPRRDQQLPARTGSGRDQRDRLRPTQHRHGRVRGAEERVDVADESRHLHARRS